MTFLTRGKRRSKRSVAAVFALAATMILAACAAEEEPGGGEGSPLVVGIVASTTGTFASSGTPFVAGFNAGLEHATEGTGEIDGREIQVEVRNDNGDPATGVAGANELLGMGAKFITGPTSSSVALAVGDATTSNGGTFVAAMSASSEQLYKDPNYFLAGPGGWMGNAAVIEAVPEAGTLVHIGSDDEFGQDADKTLKAMGKQRELTVESVLVPPSTQDFTAAVLQALQNGPDMIFVGWQGDGTAQLFTALAQQDAYSKTEIAAPVTFRAAVPLVAEAAGENISKLIGFSPYYEGIGTGDDLEKNMIEFVKSEGEEVDYSTVIGFISAQMIAHAISETNGEADQEGVTAALEGHELETPVGPIKVLEESHMLTFPTYSVKITEDGNGYDVSALERFSGDDLAETALAVIPKP